VTSLLAALESHGIPPKVRAMTAACDAWQYNNTAGIPTVVFGPGTLGYAHAKDEQIRFEDMLTAAGVLVDFVKDYK
jgi:acetylornithine deacetylase/succinyl-diaminopimelate desuccinylase-like protein